MSVIYFPEQLFTIALLFKCKFCVAYFWNKITKWEKCHLGWIGTVPTNLIFTFILWKISHGLKSDS